MAKAETKKEGTITKTFAELVEIDTLVAALYRKVPEVKDSKFGYWYTKWYQKNYEPTFKEMQAELEIARIDHALENETTHAIVLDPTSQRGYAYSKQGSKDIFNAEQKIDKKYRDIEVEVVPMKSTYVPKELSEELAELLKGILI